MSTSEAEALEVNDAFANEFKFETVVELENVLEGEEVEEVDGEGEAPSSWKMEYAPCFSSESISEALNWLLV